MFHLAGAPSETLQRENRVNNCGVTSDAEMRREEAKDWRDVGLAVAEARPAGN